MSFSVFKSKIQYQIKSLKQSFFQSSDNHLNDLLCSDRLHQLEETSENYQASIFTPLVTLNAFLWQVLSDNGGCKEAVSRIFSDRLQQNIKPNSLNTGPYCKARQRLSLPWIIKEVRLIGSKLHKNAGDRWAWKGFNVVMVDGTTVSMPDTPKNQESYPQQSAQKVGLGFPIARIVALISLNAGTIINYTVGPYKGKNTGETSMFSKLIDSFNKGDLLLADRYYCTYAILILLIRKNIAFVSPIHSQKKPDFKPGEKDRITDWKKPPRKPVWMTTEDYASLPETLTVRELMVGGRIYVTTLLDRKAYPKDSIADLYQQRWKIELDFRTIKNNLNMDVLRCNTPEMVEKEIAVHFMAYNLIRGSIAESAFWHNENPRSISFKATYQILNYTRCKLHQDFELFLLKCRGEILNAIISTPIGKRKRPPQPRAVKRRPKAYSLLTEPRKEACEKLGNNYA